MARSVTYSVLLASLLGAGALLASAQVTRQPTKEDRRAEEEVRRLSAEELGAFLHKDPKAMARLWSDDFVGRWSMSGSMMTP